VTLLKASVRHVFQNADADAVFARSVETGVALPTDFHDIPRYAMLDTTTAEINDYSRDLSLKIRLESHHHRPTIN